jgi:adenylate cyclase
MTDASPELAAPSTWVTAAGLAGTSELELLRGFSERLRQVDVPVTRALILIDTLHPLHEGRVFRWQTGHATKIEEYGRMTEDDPHADMWRRSPFHYLDQTGEPMLRRRLADGGGPEFPIFEDLRREGQTDYLVCAHRLSGQHVVGGMECVYSSWTTDAYPGFSDDNIQLLSRSLPAFALAAKCASLTRIAATLAETYLGRDAGQRVLHGGIMRGVADRIDAVIWFSDLRGFTRITDSTDPALIIPLLNDYDEAVISSVHDAGGEVLKLIGDGILAIFRAEQPGDACRRALEADAQTFQKVDALNERRRARNLPVTTTYLGLHVGEVFYGNIGSSDRLDFTVVGPAVNEASRVAAMCRSVERRVLLSPSFAAAALKEDKKRLVSVGRYALRGVAQPQELFTLEDFRAPA